MSQINIQYFQHPYADFILGSYNHQLCVCDFRYRKKRDVVDKRIQSGLKAKYIEQNSDTIEAAKIQLNEYFMGQRKEFDIPLLTVGSDFQKQVWQALEKIEYGATASYLDLANSINNPKAVRAVANANGANALAIMIPCHRIIGKSGELVGFGGGLVLKKRLLELENGLFMNQT